MPGSGTTTGAKPKFGAFVAVEVPFGNDPARMLAPARSVLALAAKSEMSRSVVPGVCVSTGSIHLELTAISILKIPICTAELMLAALSELFVESNTQKYSWRPGVVFGKLEV